MPDMSHAGSSTGTGNPPGEYSKGYLKSPYGSEAGKDGHFVTGKSYRGSMNVGMGDTAQVDKPRTERTLGLNSMYEGGIDKTV